MNSIISDTSSHAFPGFKVSLDIQTTLFHKVKEYTAWYMENQVRIRRLFSD